MYDDIIYIRYIRLHSVRISCHIPWYYAYTMVYQKYHLSLLETDCKEKKRWANRSMQNDMKSCFEQFGEIIENGNLAIQSVI